MAGLTAAIQRADLVPPPDICPIIVYNMPSKLKTECKAWASALQRQLAGIYFWFPVVQLPVILWNSPVRIISQMHMKTRQTVPHRYNTKNYKGKEKTFSKCR